MDLPERCAEFWNAFLATRRNVDASRFYEAFAFGDSEALANELAQLVLAGTKRATAGSLWSLEAEAKPLPRPGDLSIVTDWQGQPLCVIETKRVDVVPFCDVTAEFAAVEGEGDGSLAHWIDGHTRYFGRECARLGRTFTPDMPVICERFDVVDRAVAHAQAGIARRSFDPLSTYVHLAPDGEGRTVPGGDAFWSLPDSEIERFGHGWLVAEFAFDTDWPNWEMHPQADELVYLLEGAVDLLLERPGGIERVPLAGRDAVLVPRGVWHTAKVHAPARMLHVTMGAGTQQRAVRGA